jgi:hypothetical protein
MNERAPSLCASTHIKMNLYVDKLFSMSKFEHLPTNNPPKTIIYPSYYQEPLPTNNSPKTIIYPSYYQEPLPTNNPPKTFIYPSYYQEPLPTNNPPKTFIYPSYYQEPLPTSYLICNKSTYSQGESAPQ